MLTDLKSTFDLDQSFGSQDLVPLGPLWLSTLMVSISSCNALTHLNICGGIWVVSVRKQEAFHLYSIYWPAISCAENCCVMNTSQFLERGFRHLSVECLSALISTTCEQSFGNWTVWLIHWCGLICVCSGSQKACGYGHAVSQEGNNFVACNPYMCFIFLSRLQHWGSA